MPERRGDPLAEWRQALLKNEEGNPRANLYNAMLALRLAPALQGRAGYDKLRSQAMVMQPLPWDPSVTEPREWRDVDDTMLAEWLQGEGVNVSSAVAREAVQAVAYENSYHPVLMYLDGLSWDGESRLDRWTIDYLGVADSEYVRAVSSKWMISGVARIYQPGCKADCALVLEGPQGSGKSTLLRNLSTPWFTDEIAAFGTKDASEQTIGVWIVELSELEAVTRAADVAHVKAFMSRQRDRFRVSYGHRVQEYPRQCVFAATSNSSTWNRDDTGGRRWWPLTCGKVWAEEIKAARDQLWAEARDRYFAGETWYIDDALLAQVAEGEQEDRTVEDPLTRAVLDEISFRPSVSTAELMTQLSIPKDKQKTAEAMRFAAILTKAGWTRRKTRIGKSSVWRFYPPKDE
jgi:predicted P-loop ATPase